MAKKSSRVAKKPTKPAKKVSKKPPAKKIPKPTKIKAKTRPKPKAPAPVMQETVTAVPKGFHTVTPHLIVRGAAEAIEFYRKVFGAEETMRMPGPGGMLMHAEIRIGDSHVFLCDEFEGTPRSAQTLGGTPVTITLYLPDCDATFNQAVAAGARPLMPPMDMFWGDRFAKVADPFGHEWALATHKEDVSLEEMGKRFEAFTAQMAAPRDGAPPDGTPPDGTQPAPGVTE